MFDFQDRVVKAAIKTLIPMVRDNKSKTNDIVSKIINDQDLLPGEEECGIVLMKNDKDTIDVSLCAFSNNTVVRIIDSKELPELIISIIEGINQKK